MRSTDSIRNSTPALLTSFIANPLANLVRIIEGFAILANARDFSEHELRGVRPSTPVRATLSWARGGALLPTVPFRSIFAAAWGLTASRDTHLLPTRATAATILALMFEILAAFGLPLNGGQHSPLLGGAGIGISVQGDALPAIMLVSCVSLTGRNSLPDI